MSFTLNGYDAGTIATRLDREFGVMVRAGLHCAPAAHGRLGTHPDGSLRVGVGPFTDAHDVDRLVHGVRTIVNHNHH